MDENIGNEHLDERIIYDSISQGTEIISHEIIFKVLSEPLRRKLITLIGPVGRSLSLIEKEMKIEKSLLKYHIDFLKEEGYIVIEDNVYKLNEKGQSLLSRI